MRILFKSIVVVVVCVAVVLLATGLYVRHLLRNTDQYLPQLQAYLQQKTGKQILLRHLHVRLVPLTVQLDGVEIKNPKPFPAGDFLSVPQMTLRIRARDLLWKQVVVDSLVLDHPVFDFISDPDGLWNFQNPKNSLQQNVSYSSGRIESLQVNHGELLGSALIDPQDTPGPVVLHVQDFSAQLRRIDFETFSSGNTPHPIRGSLQASAAVFGKVHLRNLQGKLRVLPHQVEIKGFQAKTYRGHANGDFAFNFADKRTRFDTTLHATGLGVAYLLSEFENGPAKMTGMMEATVRLFGVVEHTANPLAGIQGAGTFTIRQGELPSLNHSKQMTQIKNYRTPAATHLPVGAFSTFTGDMNLDHQHIASKRIGVDFYGVTLDGAGTLTETTGGMDYRGRVTILKKQGFFKDIFAQLFKDAQVKNGRITFPIRVSGTLSNPQVTILD